MSEHPQLTRRSLVSGMLGGASLILLGAEGLRAAPARRKLTPAEMKLVMHRNAGCGCCVKWADAAREAGFTVTTVDSPDLMALKAKAGVPQRLMSCHTTLAGPYAIEGHVPLDAVKKLLLERPKVKGIAVPGMPLGSPGMEAHGHGAEPFDVYAFDSAGAVTLFR